MFLIGTVSLILMLVSGPGEVEARRDTHYEDLNAAMEKMSYGRFEIPVSIIQNPEEKYRARVAKQRNVDALEESLVNYGTVNEHVELVLFTARPPVKGGFKPPTTQEELKGRGFEGYFTIVGDHTQRAMNQLHKKYKKNPKWASLTATIYVCTRNEGNYQTLKSWGILDNIKGEKRVTVSFLDKMTCLREDFLALQEHSSDAGHKERTAQLKVQRAKDFGGVSSGQLMQLWSLASRSSAVWSLLQQIMSGDYVPSARAKNSNRRQGQKAKKEMKSASQFTNIGGLEDSALIPLLEDIVHGRSTLTKLNDMCGLMKARVRVQTAVLTDGNVSQTSWEDAARTFPRACDAAFVERWAITVNRMKIKQKESLPETFFEELDRRVTADRSQPVAAGQVLTAVSLILMSRVMPHWPHSSLKRPVCTLQGPVLTDEERVFVCTLHAQDIKLFCHDIMQLSTLQREIQSTYGRSPAYVCLRCVININGLLCVLMACSLILMA